MHPAPLRLPLFILVGLVVAATGEYMFSVIVRQDWDNFLGSIFFNSLYLLGVYLSSRLLFRWVKPPLAALLVYYFFCGFTGLLVEWFLIGNPPWGNPDASQWGMFAYWTAMTMLPLIFTDPRPGLGSLRRAIALSFSLFSGFSIAAGYLLPAGDLRFAAMIWLVILGYSALTLLYIPYARLVQNLPE